MQWSLKCTRREIGSHRSNNGPRTKSAKLPVFRLWNGRQGREDLAMNRFERRPLAGKPLNPPRSEKTAPHQNRQTAALQNNCPLVGLLPPGMTREIEVQHRPSPPP